MTFQVDKDNPAFRIVTNELAEISTRSLLGSASMHGPSIHTRSYTHPSCSCLAKLVILPFLSQRFCQALGGTLPAGLAYRPWLDSLKKSHRSRVQRWGLLVLTASDSFQEYTRHNKRNPTKESSRAMTSQPQPGVKATMQKHNLALLWELEPKSQC